ncbi:hypothetical protein [Endozoicomonas sp. 8E]|uniref:hypothetical protein n=1 Tax=Endozoicomonas sp. 8E TaxID=3035692 RepID=UPI0029391000|nr:hypothetical protein [Endozoicomonas sp. 8E]WOG29775.1 hypothetical protein P6910_08995 [Endozoicomonas sp. 8E]
MINPLEIAKYYFQLSNDSNFDEITKLFCESSTYRSGKGELFLGVNDIMTMQRLYHGKFARLQWQVSSVIETKPGIVHFTFNFVGEMHTGEIVEYSGLEDVVVYDGKIQHIQVRRL